MKGREASAWWKELVRIRDGVSLDVEILFWTDWWLGDFKFCDRFSRLFDLTANQSITMAQMFQLGLNDGGEAWKWRLHLLAWEEELVGECTELLPNVFLQVNNVDEWIWMLDLGAGYSMCGAYQFFTSQETQYFTVVPEVIWHMLH